MALVEVIADPEQRRLAAADAVNEADKAVAARSGMQGMAAQAGLQTIHRLRPGFLERQVHQLLPAWATELEPHWLAGRAQGDAEAWFVDHAEDIAAAMLGVTDRHVEQATDASATAVYRRLRPAANRRISAEMPRIVAFVSRWANETSDASPTTPDPPSD